MNNQLAAKNLVGEGYCFAQHDEEMCFLPKCTHHMILIEYLKKLALKEKMEWETGIKQKPVVPPESISLSFLRGEIVINDGVQDVLGCIYNHLGFNNIVSGTRKDKLWNKVLKYCLFMRSLEPASKLKSICLIQDRFQKLFSQVCNTKEDFRGREPNIQGVWNRASSFSLQAFITLKGLS